MQLVAHRGNAVEFPENTLASFSSALQLGAHWVELDVQLAGDHVPMVIHDHTLERTTTGTGRVFDQDSATLGALSAGEPQRFGTRFRDVRLVPLRAALQLMRGAPQARLFVEIKTESLEHFGHREVLERVLEVIGTDLGQCVLISFDAEAVEMARTLGGAAIGWVLHSYDEAAQRRCSALAPEFLFCNYTKFPSQAAPWPGRWRWASYEVRDPLVARQLAARGVALIETMAVRDMSAALAGELAAP